MIDYIIRLMPSMLSGLPDNPRNFCYNTHSFHTSRDTCSYWEAIKNKALVAVLQVYIWVMRGTPLLLQIVFIFLGCQ